MKKTKFSHKVIAVFLTLNFLSTIIPANQLYANNNGPNAPDAASFEPVDATDMVDLLTGDMGYVLPLMTVPSPEGGYPLALAYHGGIAYDQEASWVGLGWSLNPGAINRYVNGHPDDWSGAKIRTVEQFQHKTHSVTGGVGYGNVDVGIGASWDSNKMRMGSVSVGLGDEDSGLSARVGVGYSTEDGVFGNLGVGIGPKNGENGLGLGISVDTRGFFSIGASYSFGEKAKDNRIGTAPGIGISLTSGGGNTSFGANVGDSKFSTSSRGGGSTSSWGVQARIYLYGVYARLGYGQTTFKINKKEEDHVWGPLYYDVLASNPVSVPHISYGTGIWNEHLRDSFMDSYEQKIPKAINDFVAYEDVFKRQKDNYTRPFYDNYSVNAQGLSGSIAPKLLENGIIVSEGKNIEYDQQDRGMGSGPECDPQRPLLGFESLGRKINTRTMYVNSHFNPATKFTKNFGLNGNLQFYFNNSFPSDVAVAEQTFQAVNNAVDLNQYLTQPKSGIYERKENGNFVETFKNSDIEILKAQNNFLEAKDYNRANDSGYKADGIGGYRITAADGKTYHYSRPVYHFEQIHRQLYPTGTGGSYPEHDFYKETRRAESYATHWLLTAVTGPDFVKNTNNKYPEEGDYGYWVRFDYGTWTDGYAWRMPYTDYNQIKVGEGKIAQEYSWGRKQQVYLNKVVTRTHTALFVKSLRKDSESAYIGNPATGGYPTIAADASDADVEYPFQKTLKLDEIILLKNKDYNENIVNEATQAQTLLASEEKTALWGTMDQITYKTNQQEKVLDVNDIVNNQEIRNKALKIIKLNHNYDLAKGTINSSAEEKGRLTLNSVEVLGKGGDNILPPYKFEYIGKDVPYHFCTSVIGCTKDDWGYHKDSPELWTMNKITTPTGGKVEFSFEKDEYFTEAFSRRYWQNGLEFVVSSDGVYAYLNIKKSHWDTASPDFNFLDYFDPSEPVFLDYWFCTHNEDWKTFGGCRTYRQTLNIPPAGYVPFSVTSNSMTFRVPAYGHHVDAGDSGVLGRSFSKTHDNFAGTYDPYITDRGVCIDLPGCGGDVWNVVYNLVANKVPGTGTGGGIRVAEIKTVDENLNEYATEYTYNDPIKNRTSGITSYAPIKGQKYVAYQAEVPGPRVMYEYVKLTAKGTNGEPLGSTQYNYDVLKPVVNIFDPNMQSGNHFKAQTYAPPLDAQKGTWGADVRLHDNTAMLGSLKEVKKVNSKGQVLQKRVNEHYSLQELMTGNNNNLLGVEKESFHNMISIYDYERQIIQGSMNLGVYSESAECFMYENIFNKGRHLNVSSKTVYPAQTKSSTLFEGGHSFTKKHKNIDPKTGSFLESHITGSDGTLLKTIQTPAHTKYSNMGSKVDDINNKHMLVQEAMSRTNISTDNGVTWKTISAGVGTWNNTWTYRDNIGQETTEAGIWRKHKNFVWKGDVDADGTYGLDLHSSNFDWGIGATQSNLKWQEVSEVTRYTHWSSAVETKDINNNFASSKMADNFTKVISGGNARYTELLATGAEYLASGNAFEGEVLGADFRTSERAHTGKYGVKSIGNNNAVFSAYVKSGTDHNDTSENFRPGKYKVSFWGYKQRGVDQGTKLYYNGFAVDVAETVDAGCWKQFNYYVDVVPDANTILELKNINAEKEGPFYYDDFRMHPVYASMNTYVYDNVTDELRYTLDANNMANRYDYDAAGRLVQTLTEVQDTQEFTGGFKVTNRYRYKYKNISSDVDYEGYFNCLAEGYAPLSLISLDETCKGSLERIFKATATGGSGNYKYLWRHAIDNSNTYTDFYNGEQSQPIPYTLKLCTGNTYSKFWKAEVKVVDLLTNDEVTEIIEVYDKKCNVILEDVRTYCNPSLEVTKCHTECNDSNYAFHIHNEDPNTEGAFNYSYSYYDSGTNTWSEYIDVSDTNGVFCPKLYALAGINCVSGYAQNIRIKYKIINKATSVTCVGEAVVVLDCIPTSDVPNYTISTINSNLLPVVSNGNTVVELGVSGEVISVINLIGE